MLDRARVCCVLGVLSCFACGNDDPAQSENAVTAGQTAGAQSRNTGASGTGGAQSGGAGRRSPLSCAPQSTEPLHCGASTCPTTAKFEQNSCFVACCVTLEGAQRCGFRGTSPAFATECVLPAVADPTCDEVVQFQGCCEPTQHVCGIIGGFAPGCATKSNFVTLPAEPKACGSSDADGGTDADAGTP